MGDPELRTAVMTAKEIAMYSTQVAVVAAVLLFPALNARAEETKAKYDPRAAFSESDTSGDGQIDRQEFYTRIVEVFYHSDTNKDAFLEEEEIARLSFPTDMKNADSNHDARLSVHEFVRIRDLDFEEADRDKDGLLSVDEVVDAYEVEER
jgi:Ca2+-binding EF-hand superfamily protein